MWQQRYHAHSVYSLYLHIPFCKHKCSYCDFISWERTGPDATTAAYLRSLGMQLDELKEAGLFSHTKTAYIGGGTPSLLGKDLLMLAKNVSGQLGELEEFSCEANPESLSDDLIAGLAQSGVSRLSLGVQSFCDRELKGLSRIHSAQTAIEKISAARASFLNVSIDLMCAIPYQSDESWMSTLSQAIDTGVTHISVYPLAIEENTPLYMLFHTTSSDFNSSDIQALRMQAASEYLGSCGFKRYETANYAKEGFACAHNLAYWTAQSYAGLGTGASGMFTKEQYDVFSKLVPKLPDLSRDAFRVRMNITDPPDYIAKHPQLSSMHYSFEVLDKQCALAEDLMLSARLTKGISPELSDYAREVFGSKLEYVFESLITDGLLRIENNRLIPTNKGWLMGNVLYGRLWNLTSTKPKEYIC